ncbi:hypothetical protein HanXRQr2_Chr14g0633091 [Helianthus annuus]|uniref:Uncharacterized protein n=1 Tax=Helianthus annuus TaxID=4232 RepID=A0A9K3E914_HELAN|nr:hypothetical protein HanXRQr2_Chr14g0633091 [Helianthus annuus]KAJ0839470.1 hypothetical protein HanPSC8_Chr14g0607201 [Helianthus annuus]
MIPIHGNNIPTIFNRLSFKFLQKVKDFKFFTTAVEDVSDLNQGGAAARPPVAGVDEAGQTEGLLGFGEVAVEITDGDQTVRGRVGGLRKGWRWWVR